MRYLTLAKQAEAGTKLPSGIQLAQFQQDGCHLKVRFPWFKEALWFVHSIAESQALVQSGVPRWRIWTLLELQDFLGDCYSPGNCSRSAEWADSATPRYPVAATAVKSIGAARFELATS